MKERAIVTLPTRGVVLILILMAATMSFAKAQTGISVCEARRRASELDGKVVTLNGRVIAGDSATLLKGQSCADVIVLGYDPSRVPSTFVSAIESVRRAKISGESSPDLIVVVKGRFLKATRARFGDVARIDVLEVIECTWATPLKK